MEVHWCQTPTSRVSAELKVLEQHALSGCFELKGRCGSCSLWKVIIYTVFLPRQVSWKGKRRNGELYDPWDRLLVAVVAVSVVI